MVISNFLLLPSVFAVFSRLDSFYTISTQRILYVSRLFLVSLVPLIDKPWGNTLREKLHDPVRLRYINWGAKERQQPSLSELVSPSQFRPSPSELEVSLSPSSSGPDGPVPMFTALSPTLAACVAKSSN